MSSSPHYHPCRSFSTITPKLHILHYEYTDNVIEKRAPHRSAHLAYISTFQKKGSLVLGGAVGVPPTSGLLIFRSLSVDEIKRVAENDPYVKNGVVTSFEVKPYIAVVGDDAISDDLINI